MECMVCDFGVCYVGFVGIFFKSGIDDLCESFLVEFVVCLVM